MISRRPLDRVEFTVSIIGCIRSLFRNGYREASTATSLVAHRTKCWEASDIRFQAVARL